jgi:hypothetical protein
MSALWTAVGWRTAFVPALFPAATQMLSCQCGGHGHATGRKPGASSCDGGGASSGTLVQLPVPVLAVAAGGGILAARGRPWGGAPPSCPRYFPRRRRRRSK